MTGDPKTTEETILRVLSTRGKMSAPTLNVLVPSQTFYAALRRLERSGAILFDGYVFEVGKSNFPPASS